VKIDFRNPGDDDIILMQTRLREIQGEVITNHQSGQGKTVLLSRHFDAQYCDKKIFLSH